MLYQDWGFTDNPFETRALPPSALGATLLVGRADEVEKTMRRISSSTKMTTIEGLNGAGKTSVVNVSAFKLLERHRTDEHQPLFIPCRRIFQLRVDENVDEFVKQVYYNIAQTLIEKSEDVKRHGFNLDVGPLKKWLNSPELHNFQAGIWQLSAGKGIELNSTKGFEEIGLKNIIDEWIGRIFEDDDKGGIICTIDNLEILQSSDVARQRLEELRDILFTTRGLRWVLCGSLGIVYGVVSSPRLEGYVHAPIEVKEVGEEHADDILSSRIKSFSSGESYLPLTQKGFRRIYEILKGNIRSILSHCDNYCQFVADHKNPVTDEEKDLMLERWILSTAESHYNSARSALRPRPLHTFKIACAKVLFSPSDFEDFGFNSVQAFRPSVKDLEDVGLLVTTQDEGDKRRKTIQVTSKGWLVDFHLRQGQP